MDKGTTRRAPAGPRTPSLYLTQKNNAARRPPGNGKECSPLHRSYLQTSAGQRGAGRGLDPGRAAAHTTILFQSGRRGRPAQRRF